MAEHPIQGLMGVTIEKIRDMVNAETIIGDPIHVDDTTIIPVSRVTFGFVSGGSDVGPSSTSSGSEAITLSTAETFSTSWTVRTLPLETTRNATGVTETPAPLPPPNICLLEKVSAVDNVIASLPELVDKVAALIKKEKPGADAPAE